MNNEQRADKNKNSGWFTREELRKADARTYNTLVKVIDNLIESSEQLVSPTIIFYLYPKGRKIQYAVGQLIEQAEWLNYYLGKIEEETLSFDNERYLAVDSRIKSIQNNIENIEPHYE